MSRTRLILGAIGVLVMAYGAWRILGTARLTRPRTLAVWLVAAVVLHDGVLAPLTMTAGYILGRIFRPRARRYVVGGLVTAAMVTAVAIPLIHRRGTQPTSTTLEVQDYTTHLVVILGVIAAVTTIGYLARLARDRQRMSVANERPSEDHASPSV